MFDDFVTYAKQQQGIELPTVGGRKLFRLEVLPKGFRYTPTSTNKSRLQPTEHVERVFNLYLVKGSLHPSDYTEDTFNASYLLSLVGKYFSLSKDTSVENSTIELTSVEEGIEKERKYFEKSRNKQLSLDRKKLDNYQCQACDFRLKVNGEFVIECHHLFPLSMHGKRKTKIEDLVCLCPTCHRIAHRR